MKKRLILMLPTILAISMNANAGFLFKYPIAGVKSSNNSEEPIEEIPEREPNQTAWEQFAEDNSLSYNDWNSINWRASNLDNIPNEGYPLLNPTGEINLTENNLRNINGLEVLKTVGGLNIRKNFITNLDPLHNLESSSGQLQFARNNLNDITGLHNLKSVDGNLHLGVNNLSSLKGLESLTTIGKNFTIDSNYLTNLDPLSSLTYVGGSARFNNNNLSNIDGISNLKIEGMIYVDASYNGPKLSQDSAFCLNNSEDQFGGYEDSELYSFKSNLCD